MAVMHELKVGIQCDQCGKEIFDTVNDRWYSSPDDIIEELARQERWYLDGEYSTCTECTGRGDD